MFKEWLISSRVYGKIIKKICLHGRIEGFTFSQNAEDLIIQMLIPQKYGFYVDVGAHHPIRFSNTLQLYLKGWNGINIDPLPGCVKEFKKYRSNDINLNIGISNNPGNIDYYCFSESAYNTISKNRAEYLIENNISTLEQVKKIRVVRLKKVFDKYIINKKIDVLTLDVETMELDVLTSNDWALYRPRLIVMESIVSCHKGLDSVDDDPAIVFLMNKGYVLVAKVMNSVFLLAKEELDEQKK